MKILENKFFQLLIFVLTIMIIVFFAAVIVKDFNTNDNANLISVTGTGEVYANPDVGVVDLTVTTENLSVATAADQNNQKMNAVISFVKGENVAENDIKTTNYNISPVYQYEDKTGKRSISSYQVTQTIEVKIRDLTKIGDIISGATSKGVNDIGELSFIVDNDDQVKENAKDLAIANAKAKAVSLEKALGVKLVKIVNYSESSTPIMYNLAYDSAKLMATAGSSVSSPSIQTGQNKITSTVTITYSIK